MLFIKQIRRDLLATKALRFLPVLFAMAALCFATTSARAPFDGTDGCVGSVVQASSGAALQLRCSKQSQCTSVCNHLSVSISTFTGNYTGEICNCGSSPDDN